MNQTVALNAGTKASPHDLQAESGVLGSIIIDSGAIKEIISLLTPLSFYSLANREIFASMLELRGRGEVIDLLTLTSFLRANKKLKGIGGELYLAELTGAVASSRNIIPYAKIVQEKFILREAIKMGVEVSNMGFKEGEEISETLANIKKQFTTFENSINLEINIPTGKDLLDKYMENYVKKLDIIDKGGDLFLPTGFPTLDKKASFAPGQLVVLAAITSFGKTACSLNMAVHAAQQGYKVLFVSVEMDSNMLLDRVFSGLTGLDNTFFRKASAPDQEIDRAYGEFKKFYDNFRIIYDPVCTTAKIRAIAKKLKAGEGLDFICVDYIGILADKVNKNETDAQRIDNICMGLKQMAGELNCVVLAMAQFNRETRMTTVPSLSQLKGSSGIEQSADTALILYRKDKEELEGIIRIAKNRQGSLGDIDVRFIPQTTTYIEYDNPTATIQDYNDL